MKFRDLFFIAGTATLGLAAPASATTTVLGNELPGIERAELVAIAAATPKKSRGGASVSTGDVDGDGTSDVVAATPPKPKHKPVRRVRKHK